MDLAALAREVCAEGPWPQDRLTLEGGEPVFAQVDRALIARLLQNLIDNGFKYGKPGGGVWVTLRRQGGEALLTVRDDGIGIAPDQQARVWQRFYQVDPVRGEKSGAGLGLSMVWKIAQAHGGHMSLESVPGVRGVLLPSTFQRRDRPKKRGFVGQNFMFLSCFHGKITPE